MWIDRDLEWLLAVMSLTAGVALMAWATAHAAAGLAAHVVRRTRRWRVRPLRRLTDALATVTIAGSALVATSPAGATEATATVVTRPPIAPPGTAGTGYTPVPIETAPPAVDEVAPTDAPPEAPDDVRSHVVEPGESLWAIACQAVRDAGSAKTAEVADYWLRLIALNEDHLRSGNPDLIYPGEVIQLPEVG